MSVGRKEATDEALTPAEAQHVISDRKVSRHAQLVHEHPIIEAYIVARGYARDCHKSSEAAGCVDGPAVECWQRKLRAGAVDRVARSGPHTRDWVFRPLRIGRSCAIASAHRIDLESARAVGILDEACVAHEIQRGALKHCLSQLVEVARRWLFGQTI